MALLNFFIEPSYLMGQGAQRKPDSALEDLRKIGEKVAGAVLAKDIPLLLNYDRPDLQSRDEGELKNQKSELYCYLFDSGCITWKKQPSVLEKMAHAGHLEVAVFDGGKSPQNGQRYAFLFFYDRATADKKMLRSDKFLCGEGADQVSVWSFTMVGGKWEPAKPLFDFGTDSRCPAE